MKPYTNAFAAVVEQEILKALRTGMSYSTVVASLEAIVAEMNKSAPLVIAALEASRNPT